MDAIDDEDAAEAEYLRRFDTLARMAADFDIPPDEAEELISDILLSTLVRRNISDIDAWLAAALTAAVSQRGQPEKAEMLARTIVSEFTLAGLSTRAITALGYLTEAIMLRKASTKLVSDVRDYIVSLRTSPERDFMRPTLTVSEPESGPESAP
ncbi:MAG TPA: hypothetical protein VF432_10300 [Thermoanaerobaculia bacterium]